MGLYFTQSHLVQIQNFKSGLTVSSIHILSALLYYVLPNQVRDNKEFACCPVEISQNFIVLKERRAIMVLYQCTKARITDKFAWHYRNVLSLNCRGCKFFYTISLSLYKAYNKEHVLLHLKDICVCTQTHLYKYTYFTYLIINQVIN